MQLIRTYNIPKKAYDSVIVIGNFDGVHLGHKSVIKNARFLAKKFEKKLGILTFEPHPKSFFGKKLYDFRITPFRSKFEALKNLDLDFYINIKFDDDFSKLSAEDFVLKILVKKLKVFYVVTGPDFVFGYKQSGNTDLIKKISFESKLFSFSQVEVIRERTYKISSSEIRKFLLKGELSKVKKILGRNWSIISRVVRGEKRGRKIGFPTANFNIKKFSDLCFGVYKVVIKFKSDLSNKEYSGIANYGIKPTFNNMTPVLEVNIFDFEKNIYGELLEVIFISFIRKEKKFNSLDELKVQIKKDIEMCKKDKND